MVRIKWLISITAVIFPFVMYANNNIAFVILIDESGSMQFPGHDPYKRRVDAAANFLYLLEPDDYFSVIGFGNGARIIIPIIKTSQKNTIISNLKNISSDQPFTMIREGLQEAYNVLKEVKASQKIVLLLTDGQFLSRDLPPKTDLNTYFSQVYSLCNKFANEGIIIFPIAFTNQANLEVLRKIAVLTGGKSFRAEVPLDIPKIYSEILSYFPRGLTPPIIKSGKIITQKIEVDENVLGFYITAYKKSPSSEYPQIEVISPLGEKVEGKRFKTNSSVMVKIEKPEKGTWIVKATGAKEPIDVQIVTRETIKMTIIEPSKSPISRPVNFPLRIKVEVTPKDKVHKVYALLIAQDKKKKSGITLKNMENNNSWIGEFSSFPDTGYYTLRIITRTKSGTEFIREFDVYASPSVDFSYTLNTNRILNYSCLIGVTPGTGKNTHNIKIKEASVKILRPDKSVSSLRLYDDGKVEEHGDSIKGDSKYYNIYRQTKIPGKYIVQWEILASAGEELIRFSFQDSFTKLIDAKVPILHINLNASEAELKLSFFNKSERPVTLTNFHLDQPGLTMSGSKKISINPNEENALILTIKGIHGKWPDELPSSLLLFFNLNSAQLELAGNEFVSIPIKTYTTLSKFLLIVIRFVIISLFIFILWNKLILRIILKKYNLYIYYGNNKPRTNNMANIYTGILLPYVNIDSDILSILEDIKPAKLLYSPLRRNWYLIPLSKEVEWIALDIVDNNKIRLELNKEYGFTLKENGLTIHFSIRAEIKEETWE